MATSLHITGVADADALLSSDPLALLLGMLLDQQIAMETAFEGPKKISDRIGSLDAPTLAGYDPEALVEVFRQTPAVHRFPGSMAARVQSLCAALVENWGGDASALWTRDDPDTLSWYRAMGFAESDHYLHVYAHQYTAREVRGDVLFQRERQPHTVDRRAHGHVHVVKGQWTRNADDQRRPPLIELPSVDASRSHGDVDASVIRHIARCFRLRMGPGILRAFRCSQHRDARPLSEG